MNIFQELIWLKLLASRELWYKHQSVPLQARRKTEFMEVMNSPAPPIL